jgi:CheY-like chemotaxis protein
MAALLVVDPDPFLRHLLRIALESRWHAVFEAADDDTALQILTDSRDPLVVVLSSRVPLVDGYLFLQAVATDHRLRERHAFLVMTEHAGWLPRSFQRLHEVLNMRRLLRPKDWSAVEGAIAELVRHLPAPSTTRPYRKRLPDNVGLSLS